ncbi:MAG: right-handed parallel beta-helix repeat-containing protein [Dehalococcoidia bacterium]
MRGWSLTTGRRARFGVGRRLILAGGAAGLALGAAMTAACGGGDSRPTAAPPAHSAQPTSTAAGVLSAPDVSSGDYFVSTQQCSNTGSGSRDEPFCTIQRGVDALDPGQTLTIFPGVYPERIAVSRSGSEGAPIVIQGTSAAEVIIEAGCSRFPCPEDEFPSEGVFDGLNVTGRSFVTIRQITIQNAPQHGIGAEDTNGLTIEQVITRATGMSGINVYDSSELAVRRSEVTRANLGVEYSGGDVEYPEEAISIVNTTRFDIDGNHLHDNWKEGIDVKVGSADGRVHHNMVERQCAVGIYINEAHRVEVFGNEIADAGSIEVDGSVVPCVDAIGEEADGGDGIMLAVGDLGDIGDGTLSDVSVFRNVVRRTRYACLVFWDELRESGAGAGSMMAVRVFNNVFYDCGRSEWGPGIVLDDAGESVIVNNIVARTGEGGIVGNGVGRPGNLVSHNLFFEAGEPAGEAAIEADPLFRDPSQGDFRLAERSPAVDAGTDAGLPFAGAAPDIGAFEQGLE